MAASVGEMALPRLAVSALAPVEAPSSSPSFVTTIALCCRDVVVACKDRLHAALSTPASPAAPFVASSSPADAALEATLSALVAAASPSPAPFAADELAPLQSEVQQLVATARQLPALLAALLAPTHSNASAKRALVAHRAQLVDVAKGVVGLAQDLAISRDRDAALPVNLNSPRPLAVDAVSESSAAEGERALLVASLKRKAARGRLRKSQMRDLRVLLEALRTARLSDADYGALRQSALDALDYAEHERALDADLNPLETASSVLASAAASVSVESATESAAPPGDASAVPSSQSAPLLLRSHVSSHEATASLVQLVRDFYEEHWTQLSPERQAQFKRDVHAIVASVAPPPAPTAFESERRNTVSGGVAPLGGLSSGLGVDTRPGLGGLVGKTSAKSLKTSSPSVKDKKRMSDKPLKKEGTLTLKKTAKKKSSEVRRLTLESSTPRTSTVLKVQTLTAAVLSELAGFLADHRDDLRVSALDALDRDDALAKRRSLAPAPQRDRRAAIYSQVNQLLGILRMLLVTRPSVVKELEQSAPECGTVRAVLRVEGEVRKEAQGSILALDEELAADGLYLLHMKRCLLQSLQRRGAALVHAMEQLTGSLYHSGAARDEDAGSAFLITLAFIARANSGLRELLDDMETYTYLTLFEQSTYVAKREILRNKRKEREKAEKESRKRQGTVWDDERRLSAQSPEQQADKWRAGSLGELVVRLTSVISADADFRAAFFLGYRAFATPRELLEKLFERYHVPKGEKDAAETLTIKERVAKALLYWVQHCFQDLDGALLADLRYFAEKSLVKEGLADLAKLLLLELNNDEHFAIKPLPGASELLPVPQELALYDWGVPSYDVLFQFEEVEIAEQMCVISYEAYRAIAPYELTGLKWSKPKHAIMARNVLAYAQSVERVSFWTATFVLAQTKLKDRVKALSHTIAIAKELEERKNYSGLMGLLNGLSLNSVSRLRLTWEALPRKAHDLYDKLAEYQNPSGSFKYLRDAMKNGGAQSLPYLGIYLQDLTSLDENVEFVSAPLGDKDDPSGSSAPPLPLVNFPKHQLIGNSVASCLMFQSAAGHSQFVRKEPLYSLLLELPYLNATELYYVSLEREPRLANPQ